MNYKPVIGLEVHVELKTRSKMFCGCSSDYFGKEPNTHTCPVCLGLPGALPVPNKKAIEWCTMIGIALNCKIPLFSKFDRKNYFYPDLPKGYQISQYDNPFCVNGFLNISSNNKVKKIRIRRVHMEEDTGKLIHEIIKGEKVSLIDFNRSGVPLVEIVTEPDFESSSEVKNYLQKIQQTVRYLEVADADMEKGQMRLEPNISLMKNTKIPDYKVEVKNINSFSFVEKAINYELKRQIKILNSGKTPTQETRGWNEKRNETQSQRSKEEAHDYRYFPEPDIPPIRWQSKKINSLKRQIPELPDKKIIRFQKMYKISQYYSEILTRDLSVAKYFEEAVNVSDKYGIEPLKIANILINQKINTDEILPADFIKKIIDSSKKIDIEEEKLEKIARKVIQQNKKAVNDYKNGKVQVIGFLIGMVKREIKDPMDTGKVKTTIEKVLKII